MKENIEIITNHIGQFWTKILKNGYCDIMKGPDNLDPGFWDPCRFEDPKSLTGSPKQGSM